MADQVATETEIKPDPGTMPIDDLGALIDKAAADIVQESDETWVEPEEAPAEAEEPEAQKAQPEAPAEADATEPPDVESVARQLAEEKAALLSEKYEQLQKHSSRLASEIGELRRKLTQRERIDSGDAVDTVGVPSEFEERFQRLEAMANKEAVARATQEEFARFDSRPDLAALQLGSEIQQIAPKYKDRIGQIREINDPDEARIAARDIATSVLAEAIALRISSSAKRSEEAAASAPSRQAEKRASATTSTSGGTRVARPKPASDPWKMPIGDLKQLIDANRPE